MSVLQVEVLGITLPWRDILASEGSGLKLRQHVTKDGANSFPSKAGRNPNNFGFTNDVLPPIKCDKSRNTQVDLLSGEDIISKSESQPMTEISLHDPCLNMRLDNKEENVSQRISVQEKTPTKTGAQHYISCFEILTAVVWYFLIFYNFYYLMLHYC